MWKQYIAWAEKHGLSANIKVDRVGLLERCIHHFSRTPMYFNDERYLRICLKYADCIDDPRDMFTYMHAQSIGVQHSLFWTVCF